MPRRHSAQKRKILPDTKYNSVLVARFINNVMKAGKKALAEKIVYTALQNLEKKHRVEPFEAFSNAINNVKPYTEVNSVRVGGANYQVPSVVSESRGLALAIRWIIIAAAKRPEHSMTDKLTQELFEAFNRRGMAVKKKEDTHKMAEANKAFSHFSLKKMAR